MTQERKPRQHFIYATTAGPVTEIGLRISRDGRVEFVTDMVATVVETSYERAKGPKVIERIGLDADRLHFDPMWRSSRTSIGSSPSIRTPGAFTV